MAMRPQGGEDSKSFTRMWGRIPQDRKLSHPVGNGLRDHETTPG